MNDSEDEEYVMAALNYAVALLQNGYHLKVRMCTPWCTYKNVYIVLELVTRYSCVLALPPK